MNLQEQFLNQLRRGRTPVTIYLITGIKLQGYIVWYDNYCIMLKRDEQVQIVYKHGVSTIMPNGPIDLTPFREADTNADA